MICAYGCLTAPGNTSAAGSKEQFFSGNHRLYVGDSVDYPEIQDKMPGAYQVLAPDPEEIRCCYAGRWCVAKEANENDIYAAARLLSYWVGETAQDILHLQNKGSLPVNKNELEIYESVNGELFPKGSSMLPLPVSMEEYEQQKELIAKDATSGLTIDSLAKTLRISRRLLELRFRELEGTTIGKAIAERRLEEATRQIRATKHTIVRIAADCGFSDAKHLTHRFKEKFGVSPLQYRNGATPKGQG